MRKRNIIKTADTIFWYTLYALPIICYIIYIFSVGRNPSLDLNNGPAQFCNFNNFFYEAFGEFMTVNPISLALNNLFGDESVLGLHIFDGLTVFAVLSWFVYVYLLHIFIDFLLFIPRLAHKWLDAFTRSDD